MREYRCYVKDRHSFLTDYNLEKLLEAVQDLCTVLPEYTRVSISVYDFETNCDTLLVSFRSEVV